MTKILIVDDHASVRNALCDWLAANFSNCKFFQVESGEQAISLCQKETPEIILMDYGLATINGIEATRRIKQNYPETRIIMISIHEDQRYQTEAIQAGVAYYIPKRTMQRELIPALTELINLARRKR